MATDFVTYVWPLFLFAGANMLLSGYTAIHRPFQSGVVALCRGLVFPTTFLVLGYYLLAEYGFVAALPVAEGVAAILALGLFLRHSPSKAVAAPAQ